MSIELVVSIAGLVASLAVVGAGAVCFLFWRYFDAKFEAVAASIKEVAHKNEATQSLALDNLKRIHDLETEFKVPQAVFRERMDRQDEDLKWVRDGIDGLSVALGRKANRPDVPPSDLPPMRPRAPSRPR